tara:strand:+ start:65 stop:232 length:168 start_codon:yes stop_codon:yes gene_type:complete
MKVRELVEQLMHMDPDLEVVIFGGGDIYPTLLVQYIEEDEEVEIGGGWSKIEKEG